MQATRLLAWLTNQPKKAWFFPIPRKRPLINSWSWTAVNFSVKTARAFRVTYRLITVKTFNYTTLFICICTRSSIYYRGSFIPSSGLYSFLTIESSHCFHSRIYSVRLKYHRLITRHLYQCVFIYVTIIKKQNTCVFDQKHRQAIYLAVKEFLVTYININDNKARAWEGTLIPPKIMVRAQNDTCTTASTNMKICRWCNAVVDSNGTFPCIN